MLFKKLVITAAAVGLTSGAALADDFVEWCVAAAPADAQNAEETCACMADATEGDEDARASMQDAGDIEDRNERFAALSVDAQDAVAACR